MKHNKSRFWLISLVGYVILLSTVHTVIAQNERQSFSKKDVERAKAEANSKTKAVSAQNEVLNCNGPITGVTDVAFEGLKFTTANYFALPGGGEGGGFDKAPVLTTKVELGGGCLNAHLSVIVGSAQTYGVAPLALFQVTLTPEGGTPRHMVGHYERPYGTSNGPAVALEAERDVDMLGANFFQKVGDGPHEIKPGVYRVDVWWSGNSARGAIAADFVLKLYSRK